MPIIICSYCEYVGQGATYSQQFEDVESHEQFCPQRISEEEITEKVDSP